jgi:hypothetical protein
MKDTSVVISLIALFGVLVNAWWNWRTKRWELVYAKKAEAYRRFLERASFLAHAEDPNKEYKGYLRAFHGARLVASPEVDRIITGDGSVNAAVQWLRGGDPKDAGRREKIRAEAIQPTMERAIKAMNADLRKQIGG